MKKILLLSGVSVLALAGSANAEYELCRLEGTDREYVYYAPSKEASKPAATVVTGTAALFRPYIGVDYSRTEFDFYRDPVNWPHRRENLAEDDYNTVSLVIGTKINKYFGTEVYFQKALKEKGNFLPSVKIPTSFYSLGVDALGYLPVSEKFELLGGFGLGYYNFKYKAEISGYTIDKQSEAGWGRRYTVGAQYNIDNNWTARVAYRYVDYSDVSWVDHSNEVVAGLRYNF